MWVLPAGVTIIPCEQLHGHLAIDVDHEPGDCAVVRIDSGQDATVVSADSAELLMQFVGPQSIHAAAEALGGDDSLAEQAREIVEALAADGLIARATDEEARVLALAGGNAGERLVDVTLARLANPEQSTQMAAPSGIAFALARFAELCDAPELTSIARAWVDREGMPERRVELGHAHVDLARAALATDQATRDAALTRFLASATTPDTTALVRCRIALELAGATPISADILARGRAIARDITARILTTDPSTHLLGIAHGWAGLCYALLSWCAATAAPVPAAITARLDVLASHAEPTHRGARWEWQQPESSKRVLFRCSPGWCNGSAGFVHLWTLAHQLLGRAEYLALAESAAWNAWDERWTSATLCCGTAGQAYALLRFADHTGDSRWHDRGCALAELSAQRMLAALTPTSQYHKLDHPHPGSLYHGEVGVALLAAELATPSATPRTPLFA